MPSPSISELKNAAKQKDRLRILNHFLCDCCDKPIMNFRDGYMIQGNIYFANPNQLEGLVGNNFPQEGTDLTQVKKNVFCKKCLLEVLHFDEQEPIDSVKAEFEIDVNTLDADRKALQHRARANAVKKFREQYSEGHQ